MSNRYTSLILEELNSTFSNITLSDLKKLNDLITTHEKILLIGVGRVMISLKAWVKRLKHLDLDINYFGSETESSMTGKDLLVIASSSGESIIPRKISELAKSKGIKLLYIGCTINSTISNLSDERIILLGKTKFDNKDNYKSLQPMSTLFEQQLFLLGDALALYIMEKKGITEDIVKMKHANLE